MQSSSGSSCGGYALPLNWADNREARANRLPSPADSRAVTRTGAGEVLPPSFESVFRSVCSILACMECEDDKIQEAQEYLAENAAVRQAIGAPDTAELEPHRLGMGEHNLNYWFREPSSGHRFVLRINVASQPFHENQVAYEFAALQALAPSGRTPQPVFLDDSPTAPGKGVIVETFCEGDELDFDHLQPGDLETAVRLMADVHAVPVSSDCPLHKPADPLRELYAECLERYRIYRTSAFEQARITAWVERLIAAIEPMLATSECFPEDCVHIINTETLPSHFMIEHGPARSSELRGSFIDWERPIVGEVAQDLAYFVAPTTTFWDSEWLCPANEAARIVELYWQAVDGRFSRGSFDARFPLYRAVTALRNITWCCRALVLFNRDGVHKTGKAVAKLPIYLSDDFLEHIFRECFN